MIYTCYDKIYTDQAYQALPEQAQKACLLGALFSSSEASLLPPPGAQDPFSPAANSHVRNWLNLIEVGLPRILLFPRIAVLNNCSSLATFQCLLVLRMAFRVSTGSISDGFCGIQLVLVYLDLHGFFGLTSSTAFLNGLQYQAL
jgi:hypothetical protein